MAFSGVQVRSTRNAGTPLNGYRDDLVIGETIGLSLTSTLGMSTFRWELVGRPEGSSAGGAGPEPILLGTAATASFTVDSDAPYHRDGTYVVQCTVNQGTPTETRIRALLVRLSGLALADGRVLRKLGGFEATEDSSVVTVLQGWATQVNRWLEFVRANGSGGPSIDVGNTNGGVAVQDLGVSGFSASNTKLVIDVMINTALAAPCDLEMQPNGELSGFPDEISVVHFDGTTTGNIFTPGFGFGNFNDIGLLVGTATFTQRASGIWQWTFVGYKRLNATEWALNGGGYWNQTVPMTSINMHASAANGIQPLSSIHVRAE